MDILFSLADYSSGWFSNVPTFPARRKYDLSLGLIHKNIKIALINVYDLHINVKIGNIMVRAVNVYYSIVHPHSLKFNVVNYKRHIITTFTVKLI